MTPFSFLLLIPCLFSAAASITVSVATTISPGSSLSASNPSQTWSSPNATFSFGFLLSEPPTSPPSFVAAIFYSGGVPVWSVGDGAVVDSGGTLQFLSSGTLRLVNGSGTTLWDSNTARRGISSAQLDDSGDLVLRNGTVSVWSSFDNPTDSIVPSQNFTVSKVLRSGWYSFKLVKNGNLTLVWNNSLTLRSTDTPLKVCIPYLIRGGIRYVKDTDGYVLDTYPSQWIRSTNQRYAYLPLQIPVSDFEYTV